MDPVEKTPEQLQQENDELTKKVADLEAELEVVNQVNGELTAKVEELSAEKPKAATDERDKHPEKPVLPTETFEVDGQKYKFTTPVFVYNKQRIVAKTAISDTALLSELVEKGVGVITKA